MNALRIEPPLEPPEPEAVLCCDSCGGEIYAGEEYLELSDGQRVCESCFEEIVAMWRRTAEPPEHWELR